jgi:hypothetical protein
VGLVPDNQQLNYAAGLAQIVVELFAQKMSAAAKPLPGVICLLSLMSLLIVLVSLF